MTEEKKTVVNKWFNAYKKNVAKEALSPVEVFYTRFENTPVEEIESDAHFLNNRKF